jgi:hypothetical protein
MNAQNLKDTFLIKFQESCAYSYIRRRRKSDEQNLGDTKKILGLYRRWSLGFSEDGWKPFFKFYFSGVQILDFEYFTDFNKFIFIAWFV